MKIFTILSGILMLFSCKPTAKNQLYLVDKNATVQTKQVYKKLSDLKGKKHLFGHQDDLAYGFMWSEGFRRSDIQDVTGAYPGVFGWDFGHLEKTGSNYNIDGVHKDSIRKWIQFGHEIGSVITLSWHIDNPLYSYVEWQDKNTVAQLLPGAAHHDSLKQRLDVLADFFRSLTDSEGNPIPIIFRPWHEHNGDWFWWGKTKCTPEEYVQLWRFTVEYLTKEQNIHQLLYAISPDRSRMDSNSLETDYFYAYPGDAFVDILGLDNYWDMGHGYNQTPIAEQQQHFQKSLEFLAETARQKHKLAALTETGNEAIHENNWFTQRLLKGLTSSELTKEIVYSLVWRNATKADGKKDHYYTPHKGHPAEKDFIDFYSNSFILFTDKK